jgi:hypothetical protein
MWRSLLKDGGWVGLVMLIAGGLFFVGAAAVSLVRHRPAPIAMFFVAMGCILFAGAVIGLYLRKRRYGSGPTTDEREQAIRTRADNAGALAITVMWALAFMVPFYIARASNQQTITIKAGWLPNICIAGIFVQTVVRFAASWLIRRKELSHGQG